MGTPHKHRDVIVAWANGEEIEWREGISNNWMPMNWSNPSWGDHMEYRIKPKLVKKEGWVNVYGKEADHLTRTYFLSASKEEADTKAVVGRVACIRIEWEEEE